MLQSKMEDMSVQIPPLCILIDSCSSGPLLARAAGTLATKILRSELAKRLVRRMFHCLSC